VRSLVAAAADSEQTTPLKMMVRTALALSVMSVAV